MSEPVSRWGNARAWHDALEAGFADAAVASSLVEGSCPLCNESIRFETAGQDVDFREGLACPRCRTNARQRAAAIVLFDELGGRDQARVYATEQATPFYVALKRRLPHLAGSEYVRSVRKRLRLTLWLWRQGVREPLRFADLMSLTMADASLDAIVSLDVLEHIPDHRAALRECARVLRSGGVLVLTVPFYDALPQSRRLARMRSDGTIEHLAHPEYHGDPVSGGVLCFHHLGWDLLDDMRDAGFAEVTARRVQARGAAVPVSQWVLVARR